MARTPLFAAAATIALHAALLAAVVAGLEADQPPDASPESLKIRLITPEPTAAVPLVPPVPAPQAPLPKTAQRERPALRPPVKPKPTPPSSLDAAVQEPDASVTAKAAPLSQPAAPAATAPPVPPAPPVRTSASEAAYASTNRVPPYPRISLSNGDEGTVVLRVLVTAEGTAGAVEIRTSSGFPLLDESARKTVMTWRFKPATIDGKPVAEWYQVPIPFKLQNN